MTVRDMRPNTLSDALAEMRAEHDNLPTREQEVPNMPPTPSAGIYGVATSSRNRRIRLANLQPIPA